MWRSLWVLLGMLAGCAIHRGGEADAQQSFDPGSPPRTTCPSHAGSFSEWTGDFRQYAISKGLPGRIIEQAFLGVTENPKIRNAAQAQPEFVTPVWDYLSRILTKERIAQGQELLSRHRKELDAVAGQYGVKPEIILAIWGIESDFGRFTGDVNVFEALSNVGYATDRSDFACRELLAALQISARGVLPPGKMMGSWAGAMGHTQFLPSKYLSTAIDEDKSGTADIWNSLPDVFASTANHLRQDHWRPDLPWGTEVKLPANFPYAEAELDGKFPIKHWQKIGVKKMDGKALPSWQGDTSILLLAGKKGPAFLITQNFKALLGYNYSTSYALAVAYLSEAIAHRPSIQAGWPKKDPPLSLGERMEIQRRLQILGYFNGKQDGVIGLSTRKALRLFQRHKGFVPDGYATKQMLDSLRSASAS